MKIYPSLISADLLRLADVLALLDDECDGYHLDIMDHHFVPNLTWGSAFVNAIAHATKKPLFVHLMVSKPLELVEMLQLREGDTCIVHVELLDDSIFDSMQTVWKKKGLRIGLAVNPATSVAALRQYAGRVDEILVMSVEPGFSGQTFIDVTQKIVDLVRLRGLLGHPFLIGMDGGIKVEHVAWLAELGVDSISAAQAIFGTKDIVANVRALRLAAVH